MSTIPATMHAIEIRQFGGPEALRLCERPVPAPGEGEVLIRVAAAGLNRGDLVQREGNYPPPPGASDLPGLEVSGTVAAVGGGVSGWQVGEPVCALLTGGGYAEYCVVPAAQCLRIPAGVSLIDAAALPETFCTVWGAVWGECRLAPGESLLVQGGSSGIGVTAIQMAAALGHPVFATAGSDAKCAACTELGATRAINYRTEDFVEAVKQATGGKGADVVLDMVGGDYVARELKAMADYGRLIFIAALGGDQASIHVHDIMRRRLQVTGSTLRARPVAYKAAIVDGLHRNVWPHFAAGRIRAVVDRIFPLQDAAQAHAYMATGQHIGKILLAVG